jgi:hypothetical protein
MDGGPWLKLPHRHQPMTDQPTAVQQTPEPEPLNEAAVMIAAIVYAIETESECFDDNGSILMMPCGAQCECWRVASRVIASYRAALA